MYYAINIIIKILDKTFSMKSFMFFFSFSCLFPAGHDFDTYTKSYFLRPLLLSNFLLSPNGDGLATCHVWRANFCKIWACASVIWICLRLPLVHLQGSGSLKDRMSTNLRDYGRETIIIFITTPTLNNNIRK